MRVCKREWEVDWQPSWVGGWSESIGNESSCRRRRQGFGGTWRTKGRTMTLHLMTLWHYWHHTLWGSPAHTPTGQSTWRSHDVPLAVPKGVAERSGGDHMKQVLSPLSFWVSFILCSVSMTCLLSFSFCSPFMSLCTCPDIPNPFIGSILFVPQMHLPVLYKYWPLPTCMFSSLVIISLLLVTSVHS